MELPRGTLQPLTCWLSPDDDDDAAVGIPWALLDLDAYVTDDTNHTTTTPLTTSEKEIQVSFFLARPPRVSYFCVFCPGRDHTEFAVVPTILAMDDDLVLLDIVVSPEKELYKDCDLYIYQANGGGDGKPSLDRLPRPPGRSFFHRQYVGHREAGTIGFVDLYRGIILCDVLKGDLKRLRYAPLPPPSVEESLFGAESHLKRDIAVVKGRIRYLELELKYNPSLVAWDGRYTGDNQDVEQVIGCR
jgi:hypothetical protein